MARESPLFRALFYPELVPTATLSDEMTTPATSENPVALAMSTELYDGLPVVPLPDEDDGTAMLHLLTFIYKGVKYVVLESSMIHQLI